MLEAQTACSTAPTSHLLNFGATTVTYMLKGYSSLNAPGPSVKSPAVPWTHKALLRRCDFLGKPQFFATVCRSILS
jgi:hypothetical protein